MIDYKKKYLDALERANSFQEKYGGDYAGYIFPELAESEDEKIRKFLIDYFTSYKIGNVATKLNGYRIDDILAYLEKQKEQKPAEKQDYSGLNDLERAIHRGFLSAGVENVPVTIIKETAQECLAQMRPAEWSEEDEKIITRLIGYFESFRIAGVATKWEGLDIQEVITLLKSLRNRPKSSDNWKPSEEQIYSLGTVVKGAGENSVGSVAYNLKELYEQLKRLKEDEQ